MEVEVEVEIYLSMVRGLDRLCGDLALPDRQVKAYGDTDDGPNSRTRTGGLAVSNRKWNLERRIGND